MPILELLAPNLWTTNVSLKILGADVGHRMTVVRLSSGALWVHSPVRWSRELAAELAELGTVRDLVVPSRLHDSWMKRWFDEYQDARINVAPGVAEDHPDWPASAQLAGVALPDWSPDIEQLPIRGMPWVNEFVFLHVPTRTLILADLAFHFPAGSRTGWTRTFLWLEQGWGRLRPTILLRMAIREKRAFGRSVEDVRTWDFDRIIPGHGHVLETGAREAFDVAFPPQTRAELSRKRKRRSER